MLLGSVLISNVYAKGSGVKSQNIIWKKIVRMTLKVNRSLLQAPDLLKQMTITTDNDAKKDKDAADGDGLKGTLGLVNPNVQLFG